MEPLAIGLIGCGAIGTVLAKAIDRGAVRNAKLMAVYDIIYARSKGLAAILEGKPYVAKTFEELIERKDVNFFVEAASQDAVKQYAQEVLRTGRDLMIMSVGALLDNGFLHEIVSLAEKGGRKIYVPSGAVVGLNGVKSASVGAIRRVIITSKKPPQSLESTPYVMQRKIDLSTLKERTTIYEGPAREAVKLFPANVNVAASLSLAGIGADKTIVRVIVDPSANKNVHEVYVEGEFGELRTRVVNVPSPTNPKTSYLAALSAIQTLREIGESLVIGT
ncbi:aspartate dehydrogenase [Candidatus Bathyarchaeota archaeon]|nr:aspartate dehydrogenase [Candidatus Bathyarchaeota archaeon]